MAWTGEFGHSAPALVIGCGEVGQQPRLVALQRLGPSMIGLSRERRSGATMRRES